MDDKRLARSPLRRHGITLLSSIFKRLFVCSPARKRIAVPASCICCIIRGAGQIGLDGRIYKVKSGQFYHFAAGSILEWIPESDNLACYIMFTVHVTLTRRSGHWQPDGLRETEEPELPYGSLSSEPLTALSEHAAQLYADFRSDADEAKIRHSFLHLYIKLKQASAADRPEYRTCSSMERSVAFIHRHYSSKITLGQLSKLAGMTPTSYSRGFKRWKGISPMHYVSRVRIERAKSLLDDPMYAVGDVSASVGFENENYFRRVFKSSTGVTPAFFQKRAELRVAVASCLIFAESLRNLGISPVAVINLYSPGKQFHPTRQHADAPDSSLAEQAMRQLESAKPDLIIADFRHLPYLPWLRSIAPVTVTTETKSWRENYTQFAEWTGKEKQARLQMGQLDAAVDAMRKWIRQTAGSQTFSYMRLIYEDVRIQGMIDHPLNDLLYNRLELTPGSHVPVQERLAAFHPSRLPLLETDFLFVYRHPTFTQIETMMGHYRDDQWKRMSAYRKRQIIYTSNWIAMSWTPDGQQRIMAKLYSK